MHRRLGLALALCLTSTVASPRLAAAQAPEQDPSVRRLIAEAVDEYDADRYTEAQALFRRAHEIEPSARALRGIGMASFEMGQYVVALRALSAALEETRHALTDGQREHVRGLLERTRTYVMTVRFALEPSDATVLVDGVAAEREADGTLLLDPGEYAISVEHPGFQRHSLVLRARGAGEQTLPITLQPVATEPIEREERIVREQIVRGVDPLLVTGIAALAVGGILGAASAATGALALDTQAELERDCTFGVCPGALRSTQARARELAVATDVLWVSASVLGAVGIGLLVASVLGASEETTSVNVACGTESCVAFVRGSF